MSFHNTGKESKRTPPGTVTKPPSTPPPFDQKSGTTVERIIQEIKTRRSGRSFSTNPWLRFKLSETEYVDVVERLQRGNFLEHKLKYCSNILVDRVQLFTDKLRFDYFPLTRLFVLRMPSGVHEGLLASVTDNIVQQLHLIAEENSPASEFARQINHMRSSTITFSDPEYGRHDPDDTFFYLKAQFPNVIFEISFSQKRKDLARLADEYILGSDGSVRVVVGIDIDYKDKSAMLLMWRPQVQVNNAGKEELVIHQALSDQVCLHFFYLAYTYLSQEFRTAKGEVSSHTGLRLQLKDFVPPSLLPKDTNLGRDIFISSADLCAYLCKAELIVSDIKEKRGIKESLKPGMEKRRLSSSSIEELSTDDEARFQHKEKRDAKRSGSGDKAYRGS